MKLTMLPPQTEDYALTVEEMNTILFALELRKLTLKERLEMWERYNFDHKDIIEADLAQVEALMKKLSSNGRAQS